MTPAAGEGDGARPAGADAPRLPVGRVGRPHGLDGSVYVTMPDARLLGLGARLQVDGTDVEVVRRAGTDARPIIRISGVDTREAAEQLRGAQITADRRDAPPLADGEWWAHELEGCRAVDGELVLGTVVRLVGLPSCEALEVSPAAGGPSVLVPMVRDAVRRIAPAEGVIEVDLDFIGARDLAGTGEQEAT